MADKKQPLLSIITPVYNAERYLKQCIESVLNQTFKDFELLVVNDCSTDKTAQILCEYKQNDARVAVFQTVNRGGKRKRELLP